MQGGEEIWQANATLPTQSPDSSSSSSEDFFFQSNRSRGASLKHQSTVIQAHIESSNSNKPSAIPEGLELDSSPELESKLLAMTSSITKESLDIGSSPDVEEKILKITNSITKESLNVESSPDIEEKLLEMSASLIKQSFDIESSPEIENKLIELEEVSINNNEDKIENKVVDIDSSPDFEAKMMEEYAEKEKIDINNPNNIEIPQLLLQNLAEMDSSPDLEDQKMLDLSSSIIPECSETEMSPETEENNIETQIEQTLDTLERDNKNFRPISNELEKLIIASEPQEKNVLDTSEKEKLELNSEKIIVKIPQNTPEKHVKQIKDRSLANSAIENVNDDEKENNPAPPPRKKKSRATSLSRTSPEMAANSFKRSLSLGPSRPDRKPRRQIKEHWEGNNTALVRARKRHQDSTLDVKEIDLSDRDSVGTHSDDTSLCYTKSPHAVLKRRLRAVTADRARLEHVLTGFEDQNRRIQYELADALHAARTQREISTQLAKQLAKSQKGHLQALEDNQALQLQLNASNTELNWLRNLYEEGKSVSPLSEKEDARLEWEHQHQLEQLRAEKSKVLIEKNKIEQQHTSEICKLKEDVLKWMKLYESSTRNSSGNVNETQQEKARLEALVTSLRTDLEMSLRKQNATEKELAAVKQGNVGNNLKDASTNTQQGPSPETLSRELTAEKERSRRGVSGQQL